VLHKSLGAHYPDVRLELDFQSPLQLLVAALLAARSTDVRVNTITPGLFARYPGAAELAAADPAELEEILKSVGWYRQKARAVIKLAAQLTEQHDGIVPDTFDALVALPGVGPKTANMVLGNAFGRPAVSADVHVARVVHRLGWTTTADPEAAEHAIKERFGEADWVTVNLLLILHGRRVCQAKKPQCGGCPVATGCPAAKT
jgi:endonuclease-3